MLTCFSTVWRSGVAATHDAQSANTGLSDADETDEPRDEP